MENNLLDFQNEVARMQKVPVNSVKVEGTPYKSYSDGDKKWWLWGRASIAGVSEGRVCDYGFDVTPRQK